MSPHDKHGTEVHTGDIVEFVYGGEHHTAVVEDLEEENTHHYARVTVSTLVPTTACSRRHGENPPAPPRENTKGTRPGAWARVSRITEED